MNDKDEYDALGNEVFVQTQIAAMVPRECDRFQILTWDGVPTVTFCFGRAGTILDGEDERPEANMGEAIRITHGLAQDFIDKLQLLLDEKKVTHDS